MIAVVVMSVIFGLLAVFSFYITFRQHREKGFIFTNEWLFASEKERKNMDIRIKKAEYRLGRNVFFLLGLTFLVYVAYFILWFSWLSNIGFAIMALTILYAIFKYVANVRLQASIEEEKKNMDISYKELEEEEPLI